MNIWLIDFDGKIPNLALMRISTYYKQQGAGVVLKRGFSPAELFDVPDKVFISCIFRWNRDKAMLNASLFDNCSVGGTGVNIEKNLPSDIASCEPDGDLYGQDYAVGFISRGCIRNCPWCVVPRKEGKLARVSTASDIVQDYKQAKFLDNNFLALADYELDLKWLAEKKISIDFNQGLDARLVDERAAKLLAACRWNPGPRLALDFPGEIKPVKRAIDLLGRNGINPGRITVFCLIGFSSLASDIERLLLCRDWGVNAYPMGYRNLETGEEPAKGWNRKLYNKYRRLILRMPQNKSVWSDFERDVVAK